MIAFGKYVLFLCISWLLLSNAQASPLWYRRHDQHIAPKRFFREFLPKLTETFTQKLPVQAEPSSWLHSTECEVCKLSVSLVQVLFKEGHTKAEIVDLLVKVCISLGLQDDRICIAIVREFENEVLTVIDKLVLKPDEVCGTLFGSTCGTPYNPLESWNVSLPKTPKPPVIPPSPPPKGSPKLRVLHISDIHFDSFYQPGAKAECNEPLCCRANDGQPDPGESGAGQWGDYRNCDTPLTTLENLFEHLHNRSAEYDYVMWTGDLPAHDIWNQSRGDQLSALDRLTQLFKKYFPNKTIYSALGNHESAPVNSFPPPFITNNNSISWLYNAIADSWLNWLPQDTKTTIQQGSFYQVSPYPGLRLVSINTNYCNNQNWWLLLNTTDPAGQLQWLVDVLQDAEMKKEKVHILGHMPPGISDCLKAWSWNYYNIVNRFESTIAAQFFGHTHRDEFEVFYDNVNFTRAVSMAYIVPSITPYPNLNLGYRIYELDANRSGCSWSVLDHETYILNLTQANSAGSPPQWQLEYTAKSTYNMESLYPKDWSNLIYQMRDNSTLFQTYYSLYYKSHPTDACDDKCRRDLLCALKSGRSSDPKLCSDI
ncbi:sphingomyelin phosphodiesterase-like [Haliotis rubra]|uniref:sphingomyelin phosphodiesterase-like n=1 Tax=Haliotis rubra TaxID=36100 RepID=UPI001EE5BBF0|nr:sphingomyelin phosphodiesterase-like [Haliotis rubra]